MIEKDTREVYVTIYESEHPFSEVDVGTYPDGTVMTIMDTPEELRDVAEMLHEAADEFEELRK